MTLEEQIKIVEWAMHLTAAIKSEEQQINELKSSSFKSKPLPPSLCTRVREWKVPLRSTLLLP